jgi:replication factor A1
MAEKYDKHVNEIMSAVGKDADRKEIEKELKNYVEEFRLSVTEAKKLIARKHGASMGSSEAEQKLVKDLTPLDKNVNLLCRVVFVAEKTIKVDGEDKMILSGILGDESGTVPFTHWEKGDLILVKGDVVKIEYAYITEYREEPQVNIGNRGKVTKLDKSEMPEFKGSGFKPAKDCKIIDLGEATGNLAVVGRILNVETREVSVSGEKKEVMSGIIADETGKVSFTCWGVSKMKDGDVIKVNNGYLRKWRGMPQLNFDATSVEKSKEKMPASDDLEKPVVVTIDYLSRVGGMVDAAVNGVILDVRDGSGLVFRCPECNRALQKNVCRIHGEKEGIPDLRIKAIVDDGSGAINAIMNRDITERLLGKSLDKCLKEAKKAMDQGIIQDQLFEKLVARPVCVTGNVSSDEFGLMMIANGTEFRTTDTQSEARKMLEELQ